MTQTTRQQLRKTLATFQYAASDERVSKLALVAQQNPGIIEESTKEKKNNVTTVNFVRSILTVDM